MEEEVRRIGTELDHARDQQAALVVVSPAAGVFVMPDAADMPGRFVRRGMPLGYVLDPARLRVRVLVTQAHVERVRTDVRAVAVRPAEDIGRVIPARVVREVPAASRILPSLALSLEGGGPFALDPREQDHPTVLERLFQFDLEPAEALPANIEQRVHVRFEHSHEPLAWRAFRALRRLLLSRFAI